MVLKRVLLAVLLALSASSCSTERDENDFFAPGGVGIPVVDAMLVVGRPFSDVYLTRTLAPNQSFTLERAAIRGATVSIRDDFGNVIGYSEDGDIPGRYLSMVPTSTRVLPSRTYRLSVTLDDGSLLRATTTTPRQIDVASWVLLDDTGTQVLQELSTFADHGDTVYAEPENQIQYPEGLIEVRLNSAPATGYQLGLASLDLGSQLLIDTDFLDDEDIESFTRTNSSPPFEANETYFRVPWFAVYYEGRYKLRLFAMDRNWYDLARTDPVLGGGGIGFGGEAGDNTTRPIFHVEGGIGLFGSMSADSTGFYVVPPPN